MISPEGSGRATLASRKKGAADLLREIGKGEIQSVYLLTGPETYLIDEVRRALRMAVLGPRPSEWNDDRVHAGDVDGSEVVMRANTPAVGGGRRFVQVQGVERWKEKDYRALLTYLERPNEKTVLVMVATKVDGRSKFPKRCAKVGVNMKFEPLRERELPPVIRRIAKSVGKEFTMQAEQLLLMRCGTDLQTLNSEIRKLALYVGEEPKIDVDAVGEAASGNGTANIFELCDAACSGKTGRALSLLGLELGAMDRSGPIRVNAMLARHIRLLMRAKDAGRDLAAVLGLPPFIASKYGAQAQRLSRSSLRQAHNVVYETDHDLKGGSRLAPQLIIERAVMALCDLSTTASPR